MLPTGYSFNLDGTCIYLTLGALFITQAAGQSMAIGEQIALCALMVLTSKGAAGITGAGLVTLTASLQAFGGTFFSAESIAIGIALVVGIDRIMSEGRALTNCIGNGVATMVIAKLQGERDDERFQAVLDDPSLADPDQISTSRRGRARTRRGRSRRRTRTSRGGSDARRSPCRSLSSRRWGCVRKPPPRGFAATPPAWPGGLAVRLRRRRRQRERQRLRVAAGPQALGRRRSSA